MAEPLDCCRCCCSFILTSGLTALFLWLSLRPHAPSCSIEEFYLPSLNLTFTNSSAASNRTIDFRLQLRNNMKDKGVHYSNNSLAFFYLFPTNNSPLAVANFTFPDFYQGHGKKAQRRQLAIVSAAMPWTAAIHDLRNGSAVTFRVDFTTRVKYKIMLWFTNRHSINVAGDVPVDNSGEKDKKKHKKGIKLKKSGSPGRIELGSSLGFNYFVILFYYFCNCDFFLL